MLRLTASLFTLAFAFVASAQASAQIGEAAQKRIDLNNAQIASMEAKIKKIGTKMLWTVKESQMPKVLIQRSMQLLLCHRIMAV